VLLALATFGCAGDRPQPPSEQEPSELEEAYFRDFWVSMEGRREANEETLRENEEMLGGALERSATIEDRLGEALDRERESDGDARRVSYVVCVEETTTTHVCSVDYEDGSEHETFQASLDPDSGEVRYSESDSAFETVPVP
jgi:hypothetical protein